MIVLFDMKATREFNWLLRLLHSSSFITNWGEEARVTNLSVVTPEPHLSCFVCIITNHYIVIREFVGHTESSLQTKDNFMAKYIVPSFWKSWFVLLRLCSSWDTFVLPLQILTLNTESCWIWIIQFHEFGPNNCVNIWNAIMASF